MQNGILLNTLNTESKTLLNTLNTESKTINNAIIQLGDIDDSGKGRKFLSRFIQPGLVKIEGHGIVLLKKETLDESLSTIIGSPVIIEHEDVTSKNADELRCGVISQAQYNEFDGWYYVEGIIWDEKAQELINKGWSVSCSYDFLAFNDEGGEENNIHYDKEFTQLNFTHLAIVDNPRYERANIVFNSKLKEEIKTEEKQENKDLEIDNLKEQNMLLDELKKLITKVENEKGDDMDEKDKKDIENEKVDKRKLIDEVGGILKGKVDDEVIRTIMKKMEEASYNASEDDKADNKKVKNEAEEDKKDEKKVDNEEDKKEIDELKKDVKEDIDNKCKNSKVDTSSFDKINEIYNSVKQITEPSNYVSRQEKLDNAVEYFK